MRTPLDGLRVLDLTQFQMGPYCGVMLSDMGAEVIKIENVHGGDPGRTLGTPTNGHTPYFLSLNRGKKSLPLNLFSAEGRDIFLELVKESDVVMQNFRPGVMKNIGLDHQSLVKVNPRVIMATGSGYGLSGPYSQWPGIDLVLQGMTGLMNMSGEPDSPPMPLSLALVDMTGGMYLFQGILAALLSREKYGIAQEVAVSLLDGQLALHTANLCAYMLTGNLPSKHGRGPGGAIPYQTFATSDGDIVIAIVHDIFWPKFCKALGIEKLTDDPRFITYSVRTENKEFLLPLLEDKFRTRTSKEWLEILKAHDVVSGPVYNYEELVNDPQVKHNEAIITVNHPEVGEMRVMANPWKFSETPLTIQGPAPLYGEHTREVLGRLGFGAEKIEELRRKEIIVVHEPADEK
ncbi:MAG: CaiB/BaiF CoA transferase family protein [Bacillota bacterium]